MLSTLLQARQEQLEFGQIWCLNHFRSSGSVYSKLQKNDLRPIEKLSLRKQRFMQFSSLEHEGEHYMTPRDFLFSVMFEQVERVISYTEYLFLLTILTKPHTGFHVAFKMLDADGNEMIERREFVKLQKIISKQDDFKTVKTNETEYQVPEFKRAVKVATGQELSNNILDTVFKIFDLDECLELFLMIAHYDASQQGF
ncbi:hypothetical protein A6R68_12771 [Neotoma lepida]|uniref:EF-hand domain-containing protein n=1 Tax=Neotoma lepida TaxID=56216 RepID=A0A1A6H233_NEOLE|nr:hypothetical protein A6R68_12771 [Neotoma lepida]